MANGDPGVKGPIGIQGANGSYVSVGYSSGGGGSGGGMGYLPGSGSAKDKGWYDAPSRRVKISSYTESVDVFLEDGVVANVTRDELVKYIRERELRSENEIVRTQWDRYQVAVKIVGSTDNGQES